MPRYCGEWLWSHLGLSYKGCVALLALAKEVFPLGGNIEGGSLPCLEFRPTVPFCPGFELSARFLPLLSAYPVSCHHLPMRVCCRFAGRHTTTTVPRFAEQYLRLPKLY